jgi:hypothetical protein
VGNYALKCKLPVVNHSRHLPEHSPNQKGRKALMNKEKSEPAKIIGKVELKKDDAGKAPENDLEMEEKGTEGGDKVDSGTPEISATPGPEAGAQTKSNNESAEGFMAKFAGKSVGTVVASTPYEMFKNGVFNDVYRSTVEQVATNIRGIIIATIFQAYLIIGYYLVAVFFDNDETQAFSKNRYKETSINDLAKRDDIPFTRQKLTDCIKAAAVDMELHKHGDVVDQFDHVNYEHLLQLARLKKQEQRLAVARITNGNKLTPNELKKLIDNMLGKRASQDKQIGRTLIRQLREFVRLASDEDVRSFIADKERSAVLDHTETAQLLDFSGKFRQTVSDSQEMLKQLEANLRENFQEKDQEKQLEIAQDSADLAT